MFEKIKEKKGTKIMREFLCYGNFHEHQEALQKRKKKKGIIIHS
jgi:hypothetical protein